MKAVKTVTVRHSGSFFRIKTLQLYFVESRQLKKYKKVQINNQQTIRNSQFKESSSALAKPGIATHTALSQQSTGLIRNFRFRSKTRSVTGFTPNILWHSCTMSDEAVLIHGSMQSASTSQNDYGQISPAVNFISLAAFKCCLKNVDFNRHMRGRF